MEIQLGIGTVRFILFGLLALNIYISPSTTSVWTNKCFREVPQYCDPKAPYDPSFRTVKYYLFTLKNAKIPELLHECQGTLPKDTNFNPKRRVVAVIGGFVNGICQLSVYKDIKDEFLKKGDYNVLLVDTREAFGFNYARALRNLPKISKEIARVFQNIQYQTGIPNDMIDLVGHSLGAQLAGVITNHFKVKRITGIDPTGVFFKENVPRYLRLDDTDAELVDILHCNGGGSFPTFGLNYPTGDADFYINGGLIQPSCRDISKKIVKEGDYILALALKSKSACAHLICLYYYMLSINNKFGPFKGRWCDSYPGFQDGKCDKVPSVIMGVDFSKDFASEIKKPWPRKYYLNTKKHWPYVMG